jgi:hypothetical protein
MPVMVTGGFRTVKAMAHAIEGGEVDLVGLGRPFCVDPEIGGKLLRGEADQAPSPEANLQVFFVLPWCNLQIDRMADGLEPDLTLSGEAALEHFKALETGYMKAWLAQNAVETSQV